MVDDMQDPGPAAGINYEDRRTPREKPQTLVSDRAWQHFLEFAALEGISTEAQEDWLPWFLFFQEGYYARNEESR